MHKNGGEEVLGTLTSSSKSYNFVNTDVKDKDGNPTTAFAFVENENGGTIYAGQYMNNSVSGYGKVEGTAHELFHAYQYENGQGGASIVNEVEANLFGSSIATNWAFDTGYIGANSSTGMGNDTYMGKAFQSAFSSLQGSYSGFNFIKAAMTFKAGSEKNASDAYNNYPLIRENQKKSLIKSFYPLIK